MAPHVLEPRPVLGGHQTACTSVVREAEQIVSRSLNSHRITEVGGELRLVHNVASVRRLSLHYIDYGAELTILPQQSAERFFLVQVVLSGAMWLRGSRGITQAAPGSAVLSEVGRGDVVMGYSARCARIMVKVPLRLMRDRQYALGIDPDAHLSRGPLIDVDAGPGRSWLDLVRVTISDLDTGTGIGSQPHGAAYFERLIVDGLLLSSGDCPPPRGASSRSVEAATRFITRHLADPITVTDIARASYLSVRALQEGFRRELGLTPMEYLRNGRLDAIRRELARADDATLTVGEAASRWGITHLGRFAAAYRDRFGESPSETLRKPAGHRPSWEVPAPHGMALPGAGSGQR